MDERFPDEPEDGWTTGRRLYSTELAMVTLCKFTGERYDERCDERGITHPDEECVMMYWSADAITSGFIPTEMLAPEVRTAPGADPTFVEPA